ncbi:hypothetical protein JKY72_02155 [Candidatus Gracilibacteria bacterium]|nr:hypothetical protein [Candidatus Gracilibacteria bacterium]
MKKSALLISTIFLLSACAPIGPLELEANTFLDLIAQDRQSAFESTAASFKSETSVQRFDELVDYLALDQVDDKNWQEENNNENYGVLQGALSRTDKSEDLPVLFEFTLEKNAWKILGITSDLETFEASDLEEEELAEKINSTILAFVEAVNSDDFSAFYENQMANLKKLELSENKLKEIFQSLINAELDLNFINGLNPIVVSKGFTNSDTYLNLNGRYVSEEGVLAFILQYILEDGEWKLTSIDVSTQ